MKQVVIILFSLFSCLPVNAQEKQAKEYGVFSVNHSDYLSQHDIVYLDPDYNGFNGFPLGNGDLGGMVWCNEDGLQLQINKIDLYDKPKNDLMTLRAAAQVKINLGIPCFNYLYLEDFAGRLSLAKAEASFKSATPFADTNITSWVDANSNVWVFDCETHYKGTLSEGADVSVSLKRWGSRVFNGWYGGYDKNVSAGLGNSRTYISGNTILLEDSLSGGLSFVVACRIIGEDVSARKVSERKVEATKAAQTHQKYKIILSIVTSEEAGNPQQEAIRLLDKMNEKNVAESKASHQEWWQNFWEKSFVKLGDNYIENIYYLKRYLMGSSSRGKYLSPFNGGLWVWNHDIRQWCTPHHWNTQESYWGLAAQNDCELLKPYLSTYYRLIPQATQHAKSKGVNNAILWNEAHDFSGQMVGADWGNMVNNLTPASQMASLFWEYFEFSQDKKCLNDTIYPFMKKAAEFYLGYLKWDKSKKEYYIYPSQPYEHSENSDLKNCITDRYMIEALFKNCIKAAKLLNCDKQKVQQWSHVLAHLWEPPILDLPQGGKVFGLAFKKDGTPYPDVAAYNNGQYHFGAHTVQVFPAGVMGLDQKSSEYFAIAENIALNHPREKNAITPGPIVAARLGLGQQVLNELSSSIRSLQHFNQGLFYNLDHWYALSPYAGKVKDADVVTQRDYIFDSRITYNNPDAGKSGLAAYPFVQCGMEPLGILGAAVNEMLLQSQEDKIRIFPAVPEKWECAFSLLARGAFVVSSQRTEKGEIPGVQVLSQKGNVCKIASPWPNKKVQVLNKGKNVTYTVHENVITFKTNENEKYLILPSDEQLTSPLYSGSPNKGIKSFHEAILGKKRTF